MKGRLNTLAGGLGFSPFVDVAVNAMAAIFIFLVVYVAAVPPVPSIPAPKIVNSHLPDGHWSNAYRAGISVVGGMGDLTFQVDKADELTRLGLRVDPATGIIQGLLQAEGQQPGTEPPATTLTLKWIVHDTDGREHSAESTLRINSAVVPYPLRFSHQDNNAVIRLPSAWVGKPYSTDISILGGIQPYQVDISGLPPGLSFEGGRIHGLVDANVEAGDRTITLQVKDSRSQFVQNRQDLEISQKFTLSVTLWQQLSVEPVLPAGRVGMPYRGALVASGATGPYQWIAADAQALNSINLRLDPATGMLTSESLRGNGNTIARVPIKVRVSAGNGSSAGESVKDIEAELVVLPALTFDREPPP